MNEIKIAGTITKYEYSHTIKGVKIYEGIISTERDSGVKDNLMFLSWRQDIKLGVPVVIDGEIRTNRTDSYPAKKTYIKLKNYKELTMPEQFDEISLSGCVFKKYPIRKTPLGKTIIDFSMKVENEKSISYPSLIAWGFTAKYIENLPSDKEVKILGRLQSREYTRQDGQTYIIQEITCFKVEEV